MQYIFLPAHTFYFFYFHLHTIIIPRTFTMKFTPFIAAVILPFTPIVPTVAVPLTTTILNQTSVVSTETFAPMPVSATPEGIMMPSPMDQPTETTETGLPFDNNPDNLEDFPHVVNNVDGQTEIIFPDSHPEDIDVASVTAEQLPTNSCKSLIDEMMVEVGDRIQEREEAAPTDLPHRYGEHPKIPNFHPFGKPGGHGPVVHPEYPSQELRKPEPTAVDKPNGFAQHSNRPNFHPFNIGGHGPAVHPRPYEHKPSPTATANAKLHHPDHKPSIRPGSPAFGEERPIPVSMGHGPVVHPGWQTATIAPNPTISFSNLTGGPLTAPTAIPTV